MINIFRLNATVAGLLLTSVLYAGDINNDITGSPCRYDPVTGGLNSGTATCLGPIDIDVSSGSGTLLNVNVTPRGDVANPFLISESMTGLSLDLVFTDGFGPVAPYNVLRPANPTGNSAFTGRSFSKTVTNNSGVDWLSFYMELQSLLGTPSGNAQDGLSFGQISNNPVGLSQTPTSNSFANVVLADNSRDAILFNGGVLPAGASATFKFMITDNEPDPEFFLLQRANANINGNAIPEPGTLGLMASAFLGLALLRRRH